MGLNAEIQPTSNESDDTSQQETAPSLTQTVENFGINAKAEGKLGTQAYNAFRDARDAIAELRNDDTKLCKLLTSGIEQQIREAQTLVIAEARVTQFQALHVANEQSQDNEHAEQAQEALDEIADGQEDVQEIALQKIQEAHSEAELEEYELPETE